MNASTTGGATAVAKRLTQTLTPILGDDDAVERDLRWRLQLCPGLAEFWLRMDGTLRQRLALEYSLNLKGNDMHTTPQHLDDVYIARESDGTIRANVPHIIHHSPTGFQVGYGGSGPADLALSILEDHLKRTGYEGRRERTFQGTCFRAAFALHQQFKWDYVATLDQQQRFWVIRRSVVETFLAQHRDVLDLHAQGDVKTEAE